MVVKIRREYQEELYRERADQDRLDAEVGAIAATESETLCRGV